MLTSQAQKLGQDKRATYSLYVTEWVRESERDGLCTYNVPPFSINSEINAKLMFLEKDPVMHELSE